MRWCLIALVSVLFAIPAPAAVRPILRPTLRPVYRWDTFSDCTDQVALMQRVCIGQWEQVGVYDFDTETYRPLVAGSWLPAATPPVPPLERHRRRHRRPRPRPNYGVDVERITTPPKPVYTDQDGRKLSREDAIQAIGAPAPIPADGSLPFFTAKGGTAAQRGKILAELTATGAASRFRVGSYDDSTWQMQRGRFPAGLQTIVQSPTGVVLSRTPGDPGPAGVKRIVSQLWEPRSDYNPAADPDLTRDTALPPLVAGGGAGLIFAFGSAILMAIAGAKRAAAQE